MRHTRRLSSEQEDRRHRTADAAEARRDTGRSQTDQRAPRPNHDFAPDRCLQLEGRRAHQRLVRHAIKLYFLEQDDRRHRAAETAEARRDTNGRDGAADPIARRVTRHDPPCTPHVPPRCGVPRRCRWGCLRAISFMTLRRCRGGRRRGAAPCTPHDLNNGDMPYGAASE